MKSLTKIVVAGVFLSGGSQAFAMDAGDAAAGLKVFKKCKTCHVVDEEKNKVGPHLFGIVDRIIASVDGYKYS